MKKKASELTVDELIQELGSRNEVVAVQVWQRENLLSAFEERGIAAPGERLFRRAAQKCKSMFGNCSSGWDVLYAAVCEALEEV